MKLSVRETFMLFGVILIVLFAGYWLLLLSPIKTELKANLLEYDTVKSQYDSEKVIIDSVDSLKKDQDALQAQVSDYENRLLSELDPEVISEHLVTVLADNGFVKVTNIGCSLPQYEQIQRLDGTFSPNSIQWITVNLKVAGTDGVTPGGTDKIGYDQFIKAVKEIETENPDAIHVSSITMEETNQGFQYFLVSVDVFAFHLPNRVSTIDTSEPYINWNREAIPTGGILGRPYESIPVSQIQAAYFRPFASEFAFAADPGTLTGESAATVTPTPTPASTLTPTPAA